jgi:hypothetical protein
MLNSLPQLTRDEATLTNLMVNCSSTAEKAKAWLPSIEEALSKIINAPCKVEFKRASAESKPEVAGSLFCITWPPAAGKAWVECDTKTLQICAYKAVAQNRPDELDPKLSTLEAGIVKLLLTRAIESTGESFQITNDSDIPQTSLLCLSLSFSVDGSNSYIKLWITPDMLTPDESIASVDLGKKRSALAEIPLRFELGKVELTQEELNSLEVGDIIILENSSLDAVQAVLGDPICASLKGAVTTNETTGNYSFSIQELS